MADEPKHYWCINVPGATGLNPMTVASTRRGAIARWLQVACQQEPDFLAQMDDEAIRFLWRHHRQGPEGRPYSVAYVVKINVSCVQERTDDWNE